jgi:uncharacterized protein
MTTTAPALTTGRSAGPLHRFVTDHPVLTTSALLVASSWTVHAVAIAAGLPTMVGIAASLPFFLLVPLAVSAVLGGRAEAARLLRRVLRWRFSAGWWLLVLVVLPVVTTLVAVATGTYHAPDGGWTTELFTYVVLGLLFFGLVGNLAEEMAWGGFVQSRLMDRHGLVVGALLTAIPFALFHLPLAFDGQDLSAVRWGDVALSFGVTSAIAPFMRYVVGVTFLGTGGSVLAIGMLHASFNGSGSLSTVDGWWQYGVALVIVTAALAGYRYLRAPRPADQVALAAA